MIKMNPYQISVEYFAKNFESPPNPYNKSAFESRKAFQKRLARLKRYTNYEVIDITAVG
jgi:hypothetical protein